MKACTNDIRHVCSTRALHVCCTHARNCVQHTSLKYKQHISGYVHEAHVQHTYHSSNSSTYPALVLRLCPKYTMQHASSTHAYQLPDMCRMWVHVCCWYVLHVCCSYCIFVRGIMPSPDIIHTSVFHVKKKCSDADEIRQQSGMNSHLSGKFQTLQIVHYWKGI